MTRPTVHDPAPDFMLPAGPGVTMTLHALRGRRVVLTFYPADWSPVCGDQLAIVNQALQLLLRRGAEAIGISVDGVWCHEAFREARNLHFPLLADIEPKGEVARRYGVYNPGAGTSERATFLIDEMGRVAWLEVVPADVNPGVEGVLAALDGMEPLRDPAMTASRAVA